jgi:hypothetical protein
MAVPKPSSRRRRRARPDRPAAQRRRHRREPRPAEPGARRTRQPSADDEEFWTIVFALVFAGWALLIVLWAKHEHPGWLVIRRGHLFGGGAPIGFLVFGTYLPVAVGAWRLLYPASRHVLPWAWISRRDSDEPDEAADEGDAR